MPTSNKIKKLDIKWPFRVVKKFWRGGWLHKIICLFMALIILGVSSMYGIGEWYIWSNRNKPLVLGVTFVPDYARYLGVDPQETMQAMIDDLHVKHFRLVSFWDDIEASPGHYDFSELDWEFSKAQAAGATVSLSIGLRQPRWPECHMPHWAMTQSQAEWYPQLKAFMGQVMNRYKDNPALKNYELENEYFLKVFGLCKDFSRERLVDEFKYVKSIDAKHPVIISRSNNWVGIPVGQPVPDEYGVSVYKRIWDGILTHRYLEYPYPPWYYSFYAGASKILQGKDMAIHELQAEPWTPPGYSIKDAPVSELYKSLNPDRLKQRFDYGKATGMKQIDLWGAEWWYQMKVVRNHPEIWNVAKQEFNKR